MRPTQQSRPPGPAPRLVVVGAGPRATLVLERLAAHQEVHPSTGLLEVHLVDPAQHGAGAIWRTDQPHDLCMNTLAGASTMFTDGSYTGSGPVRTGPSFAQWALQVRRGEIGGVEQVRAEFAEELARMTPWSHPSRALFGHYLVWAQHRALEALRATGRVRVVQHHARVEAIEATASGYRLLVAGQGWLPAEAVVLALGWTSVLPSTADAALAEQVAASPASQEVVWIGANSPIEQDLSALLPGQKVLVRGLGMGFFDLMSLVTIGRGGRFAPSADPRGRLVYHRSGAEPVLHVGSDRGIPYLSKTRYGSLPPAPALASLRAAIMGAPHPLPVADLIPVVLREAITEHARVLVRTHPRAVADPATLVADLEAMDPAVPLARVEALVAERIDAAHRFNPQVWEFPAREVELGSPAAMDEFVINLLRTDLDEADRGHDSALKAGLWAISCARKVLGEAATFDQVDGAGELALRRMLRWGGLLGSGPPAFRNEQLLALAEAGLVHFIGPGVVTEWTGQEFSLRSPDVPGSRVTSPVLVDAWMPLPSPDRAADPLVAGLVAQGRLRTLTRSRAGGAAVTCASADILAHTGEVIGADGRPSEGLFMVGIGVDGARRDAIQIPLPNTDSSSLREAGLVARRVLDLLGDRAAPAISTPRHLQEAQQ